MSTSAESAVQPPDNPAPQTTTSEASALPVPDRRADVDAKQLQIAALLQQVECDGLLVLEPENVAWMTSGAGFRAILDPAALPGLYLTAEGRWLIARNLDSQRLFDEELDGLGFQLKEWQWYAGRSQLLSDLCQKGKLGCDRPLGECKLVANELRLLRRTLTPYELARYKELGRVVSHALEAACRTMTANQSELEVAGQLAHRLLHRGVEPVAVEVAADGRSRDYRQGCAGTAPVKHYGVLSATGRQYGLYASASRSVAFGTLDPVFQKEHDAAAKITATYVASSWPDGVLKELLRAGQRIYQIAGFEHEWRLSPAGQVTGRSPVELALTPQTADLLRSGWALTWRASVGAALSCDTYVVTAEGPKAITSMAGNWPQKRIKIQGGSLVRPDILQR